jgi:hypothetical protein
MKEALKLCTLTYLIGWLVAKKRLPHLYVSYWTFRFLEIEQRLHKNVLCRYVISTHAVWHSTFVLITAFVSPSCPHDGWAPIKKFAIYSYGQKA